MRPSITFFFLSLMETVSAMTLITSVAQTQNSNTNANGIYGHTMTLNLLNKLRSNSNTNNLNQNLGTLDRLADEVNDKDKDGLLPANATDTSLAIKEINATSTQIRSMLQTLLLANSQSMFSVSSMQKSVEKMQEFLTEHDASLAACRMELKGLQANSVSSQITAAQQNTVNNVDAGTVLTQKEAFLQMGSGESKFEKLEKLGMLNEIQQDLARQEKKLKETRTMLIEQFGQ